MKPLSLYLAGASAELHRVRKWADALEKSSAVRITHRWFDDAHVWAGSDAKQTLEDAITHANGCLDGMRSARLLWLLLPASLAGGSLIEFGYALAHRRKTRPSLRTIASGTDVRRTIFTALADEQHEMDVHAFQSILQHANRRAAGV